MSDEANVTNEKRKPLSIRLKPRLYGLLKEKARSEGRSLAQMAERILDQQLERG